MEEKPGTPTDIEQAFPLAVSKMSGQCTDMLVFHYKQGMSISSIASIFSVEESEVRLTISNFAELFSNKENLMHVVNGIIRMKQREKKEEAQSPKNELTNKDLEIASLKKQLKEAEIKAETYLEMIKVAEALYKIPIRKKSGAK